MRRVRAGEGYEGVKADVGSRTPTSTNLTAIMGRTDLGERGTEKKTPHDQRIFAGHQPNIQDQRHGGERSEVVIKEWDSSYAEQVNRFLLSDDSHRRQTAPDHISSSMIIGMEEADEKRDGGK